MPRKFEDALKETSLTDSCIETLKPLYPKAQSLWDELSVLVEDSPGEKMVILSEIFSVFAGEEKVKLFNERCSK